MLRDELEEKAEVMGVWNFHPYQHQHRLDRLLDGLLRVEADDVGVLLVISRSLDQRSADGRPAVRVSLRYDHDVDRTAEAAQQAPQPDGLLHWILNRRLNNEHVKIGVRLIVAAGTGTEQHHARPCRNCRGEAPAYFFDQCIVRHAPTVASWTTGSNEDH